MSHTIPALKAPIDTRVLVVVALGMGFPVSTVQVQHEPLRMTQPDYGSDFR